jgi:hypothetical protein
MAVFAFGLPEFRNNRDRFDPTAFPSGRVDAQQGWDADQRGFT